MTQHRAIVSAARLAPAAMKAGVLLALAGLAGGCATSVDMSPPQPGDVTGRFVAVVCDADMSATAFADGLLSRPSPTDRDQLTVVSLPIADPGRGSGARGSTPVAQVEVSNSVMGPPKALAVNREGTLAFICETRGPAGPNATKVSDLPAGRFLYRVDVANPLAPRLLEPVDVGHTPVTVDVSPDGSLLAVCTSTPGAQVIIYPLSGGGAELGEKNTFKLVGVEDAVASSVTWHPSGRYIAVTFPSKNLVAFYEVGRSADGVALARWGAPVQVGPHPFLGVFTPDGSRFIVTELHWGPHVEGYLVGAPEGSLSVIELSKVLADTVPTDAASAPAEGAASEGVVRHTIADSAKVGISPEGIALSPCGKWIVTANLQRSMLAESDPRFTRGGSLSLLSLDPATGKLSAHGETQLMGMPEGITFDAKGRNVLVTLFRNFDQPSDRKSLQGELAVAKLYPGGKAVATEGDLKGQSVDQPPRLIMGDFYIEVGIGPHGVVIVR